MSSQKANTLLVGMGGIGTIAALNLELGGGAAVTAVLRSNYNSVRERGLNIKSIDHGVIDGFRPTAIRNTIPDLVAEQLPPYKYIVCTTKNVPDVPPTLAELIKPAVTPGVSVIVLIQNGLNIEKPIIAAFPENIVVSGVSYCGSHEIGHGNIVQDDDDEVYFGAFLNPGLDVQIQKTEAEQFTKIYAAAGKCQAVHEPNVDWMRWKKLIYNACLNSICAITDLDTGRLQLADGMLEELVRPAMNEIRAAAKAYGHDLPEELVERTMRADPITMYNPPSMQVDVRKGRYCEFENVVGEPVREGLAKGVPMPTLTVLYNLLKAKQWLLKQKNGLIEIPDPIDHSVAKS